ATLRCEAARRDCSRGRDLGAYGHCVPGGLPPGPARGQGQSSGRSSLRVGMSTSCYARLSKPMKTVPGKATPLIAPGETRGVIGAGVMGRTLLHGLFDSGALKRERAWAAASSQSSCEAASEELGIPVETDFRKRVAGSGTILICVKPKQAAK